MQGGNLIEFHEKMSESVVKYLVVSSQSKI
jgi:hypothetical protein